MYMYLALSYNLPTCCRKQKLWNKSLSHGTNYIIRIVWDLTFSNIDLWPLLTRSVRYEIGGRDCAATYLKATAVSSNVSVTLSLSSGWSAFTEKDAKDNDTISIWRRKIQMFCSQLLETLCSAAVESLLSLSKFESPFVRA